VGLSSFKFVQWAPKDASVPQHVFGCSRSSKVDDFGTNEKCVCDFLLVRHCDHGPVSHRFWDTATYWQKLPIFLTPFSFGALALYVPFGISRWS